MKLDVFNAVVLTGSAVYVACSDAPPWAIGLLGFIAGISVTLIPWGITVRTCQAFVGDREKKGTAP